MLKKKVKKIQKKMALDKVKPPKEENVARYAAVLLESVKNNFRSFGEGLSSLNEKVNRIEEKGDAAFEELGQFKIETIAKFEQIDSRFEQIDSRFDQMDTRFDRIEVRLDRIDGELLSIKTEIQDLKQSLTKKAELEKLQGLEQRVRVIEQALKIRHLTQ